MAIEQQRMTLEEFLARPEEKPALEFHPDGTITQKVSPKVRHGRIQLVLGEFIDAYAVPRRLAMTFTETRSVFGGAAYVPDVAVYRWDRLAWTADGELPEDFTEPPDIAVEIVSPGQSVTMLVRKCVWYVENGVKLALLVDPMDRVILVFRPNALPRVLRDADPIDLSEVLPEFQVTVEQLFSALKN